MNRSAGKNGANGREHHTQVTAADLSGQSAHTRTQFAEPQVFREISQIKMTSIVCTPARLVDLLEHFDGDFTLRETIFNFGGRGSTSAVASIHLQRHELEKLGSVIPRALESAPAAEDGKHQLRNRGI